MSTSAAPKTSKAKNKQTRFPVARIKRIMQKDEEVGKVAQATPVVISKALELFMQELIGQASKVCEQRGVHRVEAYHLKYAVEHTEVLDFLKELVVGIPDPTNGGQINEADLKAEAKPKRKRKAKAKKGEEPEAEEE